MDRTELRYVIGQTLGQHPEWLSDAIHGITDGMTDAIGNANMRASMKDMAMLSALALAKPSRMDPGLRSVLIAKIAAAIEPRSASPSERKILEELEST